MHQKFTKHLRPLLLFLAMIFAADGFTQTYHVRRTVGSDNNSGFDWNNAFQSIQKALAVANPGSRIFVEAGTYYPDLGFLSINDDRNSSFVLKNEVSLYGGFEPGIGIDGLEDIRNRKSILSGDLQNNDGGEIFNDNAFHVVTTFGVGIEGGPLTVLDGFLIADGNANGGGTNEWGGGMFNTGSGLTISNCDFRYNKGASGAAVTNQNSSPIFNNCTFSLNTATSNGGAIFNLSSAPKLNNCAVFNNTAGTYGGGIYNSGSSPIFTNSSIAANAANAGGGVSNKAFSNPSFINCVFEGNAASAAGGAVENNQANPVFTNSTFTGNSSTGSGGAIRNYQANPVITNSIFWNNTGANAPEIDDNYLSTSNVTYSIVKGGFAGTGNVDLDPVFGTGVNLTPCSPAVDAGSNAAVPAGVLKDINGNNRIINTTVDMGALEFSSATTYTYYRDADGDTFGSNTLSKTSFCETPPTGWITRSEDCDDGNAAINPDAVEICGNGIDDNCNGEENEDCGGGGGCELEGPLYRDEDGDGFGNPNWILANSACDNYYGYVLDNTDCNDDDATINPNAVEICGNGIDDNCNGLVDENCDPCGVFSNLTTTNISSTSATLNWSASTNPDQWQVQYKSTSKGSKWIDVPNVGPAARSVTITNLSRNQNYSWHIRAKCGKVMTKYSASIEFRTAQNSNTSAALAVNTQKEQVAQASALVVYPSPASHQFSIRLNLGTTVAAPVAIQLFDMNGKMVLNQSAGLVSGILQKQLTLPSSLSNGLYLVRITADGKVFNRKLIVNK